jgi:hypothetical protein
MASLELLKGNWDYQNKQPIYIIFQILKHDNNSILWT